MLSSSLTFIYGRNGYVKIEFLFNLNVKDGPSLDEFEELVMAGCAGNKNYLHQSTIYHRKFLKFNNF